VNFTNLTEGSYEIRVSKTGYATAYYTAKILQDEVTGGTGKVVNIPAVLYKLDADLTGTLRYQKKDGSSGNAGGATVRLEIGVNRSTNVLNAEDLKLENRVFDAEVDAATGKYTFGGVLPNVPAGAFTLTALGFTADGVDFEDYVIYGGETSYASPALKTGGSSVARTVVNDKVVTELTVISITPSVAGSDTVEILFNATLANLGSTEGLVNVLKDAAVATSIVPVTVAYSGNRIKIAPKAPWSSGKLQEFVVVLTGLSSEKGARLSSTYTSEPVFIRDAARLDFKILNVSNDGKIWLSDSAEPVVLKFSKAIDVSKLTQTEFLTPTPKTEIDGGTITMSPPQGKWPNPANLTLKNLGTLVSVDGDVYDWNTTELAALIGFAKELKDPFVLLTQDTTLRQVDSLAPITLEFSFEFDRSNANFEPTIRIDRAAPAAATGYATPAAAKTAAQAVPAGPLVEFDGKKIVVTPLINWAPTNAIVVYGTQGLRSENGIEKPGSEPFVLYVATTSSGSFGTLEKDSVTSVSSFTSPVKFTFTEPVDTAQWANNNVRIVPPQPFEISFEDKGLVVVLTPYDTYKWKDSNFVWTDASALNITSGFKVEFASGLKSATGKELQVGSGSTLNKWVSFAGGPGGLTEADSVEWLTYDSLTTVKSNFAKEGDATIQVAWKRLSKAVEGYKVWHYEGLGSAASKATLLLDVDLTGTTSSNTQRVGVDGNVNIDGDTIAIAYDLGPTAADTVKGARYEIVVQPYNGTSVGKARSVYVTPGFTFKNTTSRIANFSNSVTEGAGRNTGLFVLPAAIKTAISAAVTNGLAASQTISGTMFTIQFNQPVVAKTLTFPVKSADATLNQVLRVSIVPSIGTDSDKLEVVFRYNFIADLATDPTGITPIKVTSLTDLDLTVDITGLESDGGSTFFDVSGTHPDKEYYKSIGLYLNLDP
jgi:hypothetical protein